MIFEKIEIINRIFHWLKALSEEDERLSAKHEEGRPEEAVQGRLQPEGTAAWVGSQGEDCGVTACPSCACACACAYRRQG